MTIPTDLTLVEPIPAPEVFVDGYSNVSIQGGVLKFAFFSIATDPMTRESEARVVLRLTASIPAVVGITQAMNDLMNELNRMNAEARQEAAFDP